VLPGSVGHIGSSSRRLRALAQELALERSEVAFVAPQIACWSMCSDRPTTERQSVGLTTHTEGFDRSARRAGGEIATALRRSSARRKSTVEAKLTNNPDPTSCICAA